MSTEAGVIRGQQVLYPAQGVNPLEATFCLLKAQGHEIEELREMLDEERRARSKETAGLASQIEALRGAKQQRFEEVDDAIEGMKANMLARFKELQEQMEQVADKVARFEKVEAELESEAQGGLSVVQRLRQTETHSANNWQRLEDLRSEVERISAVLNNNSMARDPFRHSAAKHRLPALSTSVPTCTPEQQTAANSRLSAVHTPDLKMSFPRALADTPEDTPELEMSISPAAAPTHSGEIGSEVNLPGAVIQEILRRYADVLRVGSVEVNGQVVRWDTGTSTEGQLWNFSKALFKRLRQLPELGKASDEVLQQATYWVCKAVSINYALIEVLLLVRRKAGCMCTIETADALGCMITYVIEARPNQTVHIRLCWRGKNNIVYRDPLTASKKVKGTLSCMETEFPLPPIKRFAPAYRLHITFKRSLSAKLASTMSCKDVRRKQGGAETVLIEDPLHSEAVVPATLASTMSCKDAQRKRGGAETVLVEEPLHSEAVVPATLASTMTCKDVRRKQAGAETVLIKNPLHSEAVVPVSQLSVSSEVFDIDAACEELLFKTSSTGSVGSFPDMSSPVRVCSLGSGSFGPSSTLGQLRVQGLHATGVQWHIAADASRVICCRLSYGTTEERTCAVPYNANPSWNEVLDLPVLAGGRHGDVKLELLGMVNDQELLLGRTRVPASTVLISSNGDNRDLMSGQLEGEGVGSNAWMNMELLFLPDEAGCGEEACASDGEESECSLVIHAL